MAVMKANGEKGSCLQVMGKLTALSHIMNTKPPCFLIELCNSGERSIILVTTESIFSWLNDILELGHNFIVNGLFQTTCIVQGETCNVLKARKSSIVLPAPHLNISIQELHGSFPKATVSFLATFLKYEHAASVNHYSGVITEVNTLIGFVTIDNYSLVFVAHQLVLSRIPTLHIGQKVTFYNVHNVVNKPHDSVFVMCSRSFVSTQHNSEELDKVLVGGCDGVPKYITKGMTFPLIEFAIKVALGFSDLLWLHEEAKEICAAFPLCFFQKFSFSKKSAQDIRMKAIIEVAKWNKKPDHELPPKQCVIKEFMLGDNHTCLSMKKSCLQMSWHALHAQDIRNRPTLHFVSSSFVGGSVKKFVVYHCLHPLVGILAPAPDNVIFHLTDNTNQVPLLVINDKKIQVCGRRKDLHNNMVFISKFLIVRHFYFESENSVANDISLETLHIEVDAENIHKID